MKTFFVVVGLLFAVLFGVCIAFVTVRGIQFDIDIGDRIKRAANANTVELALEEMEHIVKEIERRKLTEGYTSIIYRTPDEDLGFWYKNINQAYQSLKSLSKDADPQEKSIVLVKLSETLTYHIGAQVILPNGISLFPYNTLVAAWGWFAFALSVYYILLGSYIWWKNILTI